MTQTVSIVVTRQFAPETKDDGGQSRLATESIIGFPSPDEMQIVYLRLCKQLTDRQRVAQEMKMTEIGGRLNAGDDYQI